MGTTTENIRARVSLIDQMSPGLGRITAMIGGAALAWKTWSVATDIIQKSVNEFANFESSMVGIRALVESTGRDYGEVLEAMTDQMGGLASETAIAETFLKGLTTELSVDQINKMTTAVRDASIAMGEDFNVQLPLIIKAVKQLNPAILDNIGVTVRLDRINKQITDGYFGMNTEINEATQQNAIYQEIIRQTTKFQGLESAALDTTKGKMQLLSAQTSDLFKSIGELLNPAASTTVEILTNMVTGLGSVVDAINDSDEPFADLHENFNKLNEFKKDDDSGFIGFLKEADKWLEGLFDPDINDLVDSLSELNKQKKELEEAEPGGGFFMTEEELNRRGEAYANYGNLIMGVNQAVADHTAVLAVMRKENNDKEIAESTTLTDTIIANTEAFGAAAIASEEDWSSVSIKLMEEAGVRWTEFTATRITDMDRMGNVLTRTMSSTSQRLIGSMKFLHTESSGVFRNMAADFSRLFIQEILNKMTGLLVPKMLGILGSIFDTRANDIMAMRQGADFGRFFKDGVISEVNPDSMSLVFSKATEFESEITRQNLTGGSNVTIF